MRQVLRRSVTLLAIYAVALHVILLGLAPLATANASANPFSIICHDSNGPGGEGPAKSGFIPGHACEHCSLTSALVPPPAPDVALAGRMGPPRVLHVLRPPSTPGRVGLTSDPRLARGPPRAA